MTNTHINKGHELQDSESLLDVIQLSNLLWTTNSILLEGKNTHEMLQLTLDAVCLYNDWPIGNIHLFDADAQNWTLSEICHIQGESSYIKEDSCPQFDPALHTPVWPDVQIYSFPYDKNTCMRVLIPLSNSGEVIGYMEFLSKEDVVGGHERSIYNQLGRRLGQFVAK